MISVPSSRSHTIASPLGFRRVLIATVIASLFGVTGLVRAEPGVLTQLPGAAGCINDGGSDGCAVGEAFNSPNQIALSPDGKSLYAASALADAVLILARDTKTGAVTQLAEQDGCVSETGNTGDCDRGKGLATPVSVTVSPDGRHVYVVSTASGAVAIFARDKVTGALTQLRATDACVSFDGTSGLCAVGSFVLQDASGVTVSPDGKNVYVTALLGIVVYARDNQTGLLTELSGQDGCYYNSADPRCRVGRGLFGARRMVISADGVFAYVGSANDRAITSFARDKATGALTQLAGLAGCISDDGSYGGGAPGECAVGRGFYETTSIALTKDGKSAYASSVDGLSPGAVAIFARDKKTGILTQLAGVDGCINSDGSGGCTVGRAVAATAIALSADAKTVHVASFDGVATLARDKKTGALSQLPGLNGCISDDGSGGVCSDGRALDGGTSIVISKDGKFLYTASAFDDAISAFARAKK